MKMFPACAGMNRGMIVLDWVESHVPRVCGDEPAGLTATEPVVICSPRVRG